jgi:glycosyltransferase involved in cell wall biosynthesis
MSSKTVSIIVPCYNQVQYLDECLNSVLDQTYPNWECIIVNDGSPDNTEEVAMKWTNKDERFKYLYKTNGGLSSARNEGIKNAVGTLILPLDADDKIANIYCELAINALVKNSSLSLIYANSEKFGLVNEIWDLPDFSIEKLATENLIYCSAFFKKEDWERVGGYDENLMQGLEDWEFWIAILKKGGNVIKLKETCFYYRIKETSMITSLKDENKKRIFDYISIKHADFFVQHLGSFFKLQEKINTLERNSFKNVTSKRKALKIFIKCFFGINFFKN